MQVIVRRIPESEAARLEARINKFLKDADNAGYQLAAAFESAGEIVVIFQKP